MRDKLNLHRRERDPQHRPMVEGGQFADDFFFFFKGATMFVNLRST